MHPGDHAKCLILFLCVSFLTAITLHESGHLNIFSPTYLKDGFCISNREGPALLARACALILRGRSNYAADVCARSPRPPQG